MADANNFLDFLKNKYPELLTNELRLFRELNSSSASSTASPPSTNSESAQQNVQDLHTRIQSLRWGLQVNDATDVSCEMAQAITGLTIPSRPPQAIAFLQQFFQNIIIYDVLLLSPCHQEHEMSFAQWKNCYFFLIQQILRLKFSHLDPNTEELRFQSFQKILDYLFLYWSHPQKKWYLDLLIHQLLLLSPLQMCNCCRN